jgi:hypothetical protein
MGSDYPTMNTQQLCHQFIRDLEATADPLAHEIAANVRTVLVKASKKTATLPWQTPEFAAAWGRYRAYRKRERKGWYKTPETEQRALLKLQKETGDDERLAIATLEDCEANGWTGIFVTKKPERHDGRLLDALREAGELD